MGAGPSPTESKLLDASKQLDAAVNKRDVDAIKALLADDVIVHKDDLTLKEDLKGLDAVGGWFQAYFDRYVFKSHDAIAGAVDHNEPYVAFSLWQDKGVKRKEEGGSPVSTIGMWYHIFGTAGGDTTPKIKELYFLRQLSEDEKANKVDKAPEQKTDFDPSKYAGSGKEANADCAQKHEEAAKKFNGIWASGDATVADSIMTPDVAIYDPVFGKTTTGLEDFKKYISHYNEFWTSKSNECRIAATPGNKSFLFWKSTGEMKKGGGSSEKTLYGLNMLVFDDQCKIKEVVGLRQPTE